MRTYERVYDLNGFFIEARQLFKQNNEEIDFFETKVDLDTQAYRNLDIANMLRIYTVRDNGELIGYSSHVIRPHLQHDFLQAVQDALYIRKDKRGHGVAFIKWCEEQLRGDGVRILFQTIPEINDWSLILDRLNYNKVETVYMKDLKE